MQALSNAFPLSGRTLTLAIALTLGSTAMAQTETLRIQDYPGLGNILTRVAAANGYCEKNGIKCELKTIPAGRMGTPDEIAEVALFLASAHARWSAGSMRIPWSRGCTERVFADDCVGGPTRFLPHRTAPITLPAACLPLAACGDAVTQIPCRHGTFTIPLQMPDIRLQVLYPLVPNRSVPCR